MADTPAPSLPGKRVVMNKTLLLLGSSKRVSNTDDSTDADTESLNILWGIARRAALALHPWNFALTRKKIDREDAAVSEVGPAYSYKLPLEWVCWFPWSRDSEYYFEAVEEGGFLLCDSAGPLVVRGALDVDVPAKWSPLFVDVMAYTLAVEFCHGKTQLVGLRDRLTHERAEKLDEAYRVDGRATPNRPRPSHHNSGWAGARYRSLGVRR
ncbi:hypothetical protein M9978_08345 [Sphingomonas sp. MG17]|uniref:Uncharacterized protein n=1 Tax=Sphingomonas tagetis TaxID=2949092 RepID=A0A9X2KLA0_9SPHN|nr:hypothetical protein [Sphingomonas tagetis]MCP3730437.1 hypothetical protein [Sphingomonas tagetis]